MLCTEADTTQSNSDPTNRREYLSRGNGEAMCKQQALNLLDPLKCNGCTACCRSHQDVVLQPPDDVGNYDFAFAPANDKLTVGMRAAGRSEALFPLESLQAIAPVKFLQLAETGARFAVAVLKRQPNGDCIYLGENGCTIYDRRPRVCREFDCRVVFMSQTRVERRQDIKSGWLSREVYAAGRQRCKQGLE